MPKSTFSPREIVKSMGRIFGDIGTSPIYTLTAIFLYISSTLSNIFGILFLPRKTHRKAGDYPVMPARYLLTIH